MALTLLDVVLAFAFAATSIIALATKHGRPARAALWILGPALGLHLAVDLLHAPGLQSSDASAAAAAAAAILACGALAGLAVTAMFSAMTKARSDCSRGGDPGRGSSLVGEGLWCCA